MRDRSVVLPDPGGDMFRSTGTGMTGERVRTVCTLEVPTLALTNGPVDGL